MSYRGWKHLVFVSILYVLVVPSALAQQSGLLLGLRTPSQGEPGEGFIPAQHRTLWIAPNAGRVQVVLETPRLLVPRRDGFWVVQVHTDLASCHVYEEVRAQRIRANAVPGSDDLVKNDSCGQREESWASTTAILFVGPDLVATDDYHTMRGTYHPLEVKRIGPGPLYEPVPIRTLLGAEGGAALERAADEAAAAAERQPASMPKRAVPQAQPPAPPPPVRPIYEPYWGIARRPGHWVVLGRAEPACVACDLESHTTFEVPLTLPAVLVGHDGLAMSWETIQRKIPDAKDAFSSPMRDLLVVLTDTALRAFSIRGDQLVDTGLRVSLASGEAAVMAQWATGRHVQRWTKELESLRAR